MREKSGLKPLRNWLNKWSCLTVVPQCRSEMATTNTKKNSSTNARSYSPTSAQRRKASRSCRCLSGCRSTNSQAIQRLGRLVGFGTSKTMRFFAAPRCKFVWREALRIGARPITHQRHQKQRHPRANPYDPHRSNIHQLAAWRLCLNEDL